MLDFNQGPPGPKHLHMLTFQGMTETGEVGMVSVTVHSVTEHLTLEIMMDIRPFLDKVLINSLPICHIYLGKTQ